MGGGKGGSQTTTTSPPPEVMEQYRNVIGRANNAADNPLSFYGGPQVAPFTPMQNEAFNTINQSQGMFLPYIGAAQQNFQNAARPLWDQVQQFSPEAISQYSNPYTQNVINSTMANINETNSRQQQDVIGNSISKGAWGGDRAGIAQAELARQQNLTNNQTLAGLQNQGYSQALGAFQQQQGAQLNAAGQTANNNLQAGSGMAGLGNQLQNQLLQGAGAQLQAGNQQQQQAQQYLNVPYQQFQQQQQYPFQTTQWLANISGGLGGGMGGSQTSPGPSMLSQVLGLAATGIGAWAGSDRRIKHDVEEIGTYKGKYPLYSFKYNGSDEPQTGVMAQDVEKINPDAVARDHRGIRMVNYSNLARGGAVDDELGVLPMMSPVGGLDPMQAQGNSLMAQLMAHQPEKPEEPDMLANYKTGKGIAGLIKKFTNPGLESPEPDAFHSDAAMAGLGAPDLDFSTGGLDNYTDLSLDLGNGYADGGDVDQDILDVFSPDEDQYSADLESSGLLGVPDVSSPVPINQALQPQPTGGLGVPKLPVAQDQPKAGLEPALAALSQEAAKDDESVVPAEKPSWQEALMMAGLATAAGQSPNALSNIGAGGLVGLKNWQAQKSAAQEEAQKQAELAIRKQESEAKVKELEATLEHYRTQDIVARSNAGLPITGDLTKGVLETTDAAKELTGSDFLKTLPSDRQNLVKALAEGNVAFPTGRAAATGKWQSLLNDVMQYDPTANATNLPARLATRKDFTSGKSAQNITALNTAISHLGTLAEDYDNLEASDYPAWNAVKNFVGVQSGNKELQKSMSKVSTDATAVGHELAKVFRSTGMSQKDIDDWKEKITTSATPEQKRAVIGSALDLLNGRLEALGEQYNQGMGTSKESLRLLSPKAQEAYEHLQNWSEGAEENNPGKESEKPIKLSGRPDPKSLIVGQAYETPKGIKIWDGENFN